MLLIVFILNQGVFIFLYSAREQVHKKTVREHGQGYSRDDQRDIPDYTMSCSVYKLGGTVWTGPITALVSRCNCVLHHYLSFWDFIPLLLLFQSLNWSYLSLRFYLLLILHPSGWGAVSKWLRGMQLLLWIKPQLLK